MLRNLLIAFNLILFLIISPASLAEFEGVIVTGGSSGIGYETAKIFKEKGFDVLITGRSKESIDIAVSELNSSRSLGEPKVYGLVSDVSIAQDVDRLVKYAVSDLGLNICVLVNSAAFDSMDVIENINPETFDEAFNTNVKGPYFLIKGLVGELSKCKGTVINISSISAVNGRVGNSLYALTKGAINSLTRSLAIELVDKNIRVNAVMPGAVDTPFLDKRYGDEIYEKKREIEESIPMKRFATPEEVAMVVFSLANATYTTGSIWSLDGGLEAQ